MSTPKQLYEAKRAAVHARLVSERESVENAERWCIAWEAEAAKRNLPWSAVDFWREGSRWIWEERAAGRNRPCRRSRAVRVAVALPPRPAAGQASDSALVLRRSKKGALFLHSFAASSRPSAGRPKTRSFRHGPDSFPSPGSPEDYTPRGQRPSAGGPSRHSERFTGSLQASPTGRVRLFHRALWVRVPCPRSSRTTPSRPMRTQQEMLPQDQFTRQSARAVLRGGPAASDIAARSRTTAGSRAQLYRVRAWGGRRSPVRARLGLGGEPPKLLLTAPVACR